MAIAIKIEFILQSLIHLISVWRKINIEQIFKKNKNKTYILQKHMKMLECKTKTRIILVTSICPSVMQSDYFLKH